MIMTQIHTKIKVKNQLVQEVGKVVVVILAPVQHSKARALLWQADSNAQVTLQKQVTSIVRDN